MDKSLSLVYLDEDLTNLFAWSKLPRPIGEQGRDEGGTGQGEGPSSRWGGDLMVKEIGTINLHKGEWRAFQQVLLPVLPGQEILS